MLELFPGDLVSEKENNQEIARYLVISRVIQNQNAQYCTFDYVEYNCIITYFNGKVYHRPEKVGTWWIIDTINLNSNREDWEVVVRSGLSWSDEYEKENRA